MKLDGKVAFITGAANGIGRTTALLFADKERLSSSPISMKKTGEKRSLK